MLNAGSQARDHRMRYRRTSRLRRVGKWAGLAVCVLFVGLVPKYGRLLDFDHGIVFPKNRLIDAFFLNASFSLWIGFVIAAFATAILWRRDRRPRRGHCPRCGYNLTGAEHEKCPECGAGVEASARRP